MKLAICDKLRWIPKRSVAFGLLVFVCVGLAYGVMRLEGLFEESAQLDFGTAAFKSGDYDRAVNVLKPYAERRNASAEQIMGIAYAFGLGVTRDRKRAQVLLQDWLSQKSLNRLMPQMCLWVARSYENGDVVKADKGQAMAWYQIAADLGSVDARRRLKTLMDPNSRSN